MSEISPTEIYKALNNTDPSFMQEYFIRKNVKYYLRTRDLLQIPVAKSMMFDIDSIKYRGSLLWRGMPEFSKKSLVSCHIQKEHQKLDLRKV